jgi:hypothetical protein
MVLFEASLEPATQALNKLQKDTGMNEGQLNLFRDKKNTVIVGLPHHEDLIARLRFRRRID